MRLTADGFLGIGTAAPTAQLHVVGSSVLTGSTTLGTGVNQITLNGANGTITTGTSGSLTIPTLRATSNMFHMACTVTGPGVATKRGFSNMGTITHTASSGIYVVNFSTAHPLGTAYGVSVSVAAGSAGGFASYTINTNSQITVYTWSKTGTATDYAFTLNTIP